MKCDKEVMPFKGLKNATIKTSRVSYIVEAVGM
jgi:hypothetical protein